MSGFEGPALGAAAKAAWQVGKRFAATTEFDRLCQRLSERFRDVAEYGASDFARFADDDAFALALGRYVTPPHDFDRAALIAAITPLVGDLDGETSAETFAGMLADAIQDEVRVAKRGDDLVRLEADRIIGEVHEAAQQPPDVGGVSIEWAPAPARAAVRRLAETNAVEASALQRALEGRDLSVELPGLVADPPRWLTTGGTDLWRTVARLAEVCGLWDEARKAHEERAERPDADRAAALMAASTSAGFAGDSAGQEALRDRARRVNAEHPIVRLVDINDDPDAERRLELLDELGEPNDADHLGIALAARCIALLEIEREEQAEAAVRRAIEVAPEQAQVREASAMVVVVRNRALRRAGRATERRALLRAAETYRGLREELLASRRYAESGWILQRIAESQNLADRSDLARLTVGEATDKELDADDVSLGLAEVAFNVGDPELAERLLLHYQGDAPAARLMQAQLMLRDSNRREEGLAILDQAVAEGSHEVACLRLIAAAPASGEVPWSDQAEALVRQTEPALASFIKAEWHERAGRADEARRELARHRDDPRALRELMVRYAEQEQWSRSAGFARTLLRTSPPVRARVMAAQALVRAGATQEAEPVLRAVLGDEEADAEERRVAFDELVRMLLEAGRNPEARELAEQAVAAGRESASWIVAYTLAREGSLSEARRHIEGLEPRNVGDARLAADLHFVEDSGVDALRAIVTVADALPEPDEQVELRATLALMRCDDDAPVPPELAERASPVSFIERFPNSTALRRESLQDDEIPDRLRSLAEHRARVVQEAEEHVLRLGDWPVGVLAAAVSKSLAEAWAMMPQLPIAYEAESLEDEVRVAAEAAGGPLVIDTAALYCLHLLGEELVELVFAEYPLIQKPQATLDDLIQTVSLDLTKGQDRVMNFSWDLEHDRPVVTEMTAAEAQAPRRAAEAMQRVAERMSTAPAPFESETTPATGRTIIQRSYAEAVAAAQVARCPVYTDDRMFRRAMKNDNVRMFGTVALLKSLRESDVLDESRYQQALDRLRERGALGVEDDQAAD